MRILISGLIVILTIVLYIKSTHSSIESYLLRGWSNSDHRYRDIPFKTHIRKIRRPRNPLDLSTMGIFDDIPVEMPDVTDRHTLLQLAQMTSNAYIKQGSDEWIEPSKHFSGEVISFGWKKDDDGLRGHIFSTPDKKTVVIAIKGTSAGLIGGGGPSSKNDKFNDNLLFSCCCARVSWTWTPVCDCYNGGWQCHEECLETSIEKESVYYPVATNLYNNVSYMFPDSNIWITGHSLGGALASMLGLTFGVPSVTFEAPGDRLPSQRLHLPQPPAELSGVYHVYHTADPVAEGTCNGMLSPCNAAGFAMETRCHTGLSIVYDTVSKFGWAVDLRHHRIATVINEILEHEWKDDDGVVYVPKPEAEGLWAVKS
ncbi:alpha/beta-hydrolase [Wallemia mellicola]|uniref:triacylglycerol lipase n=2 Tax=Wallemia mellicola TaxID=1708541 RepID=A0A4T0P353_9BASI|nr:alpha/beta-hydrolase [Wallemia mellicola]TIC45780.1 alpha/beta-hydrolase [Wallemia mellicola]